MNTDPRIVGEILLGSRGTNPGAPLSHFADLLPWERLPAYAPDDSLVKETHRRYHDELQERARAGDRYAKSMLLGHAYQEPSDA